MFKSIAEPRWPDSAPAQSELAAKFQRYVLERLKWAETLVGDDLGSVRHLIEDLGAVNVAKVLVDPIEIRNPPRRKLTGYGLSHCFSSGSSVTTTLIKSTRSPPGN